jgi:hypothetical protein
MKKLGRSRMVKAGFSATEPAYWRNNRLPIEWNVPDQGNSSASTPNVAPPRLVARICCVRRVMLDTEAHEIFLFSRYSIVPIGAM